MEAPAPRPVAPHDPTTPVRTRPLVMRLALVLLAATVALGVRVVMGGGVSERPRLGAYEGERAEVARETIRKLTEALLAMQRKDGRFEPPPETGAGARTRLEDLHASALATAVLTRVQRRLPDLDIPFLADAVTRGTTALADALGPDGAIGQQEDSVETRPFRSRATAAALIAFVGNERDAVALASARAAGPALARYVGEGMTGGWPRAMAAFAVDQVYRQRRQVIFPEPGRSARVMLVREVDVPAALEEQLLAEVVVRMVRAPGAEAVDAFLQQMRALILASPPVWQERRTPVWSWWMQAWIIARGGPEGRAWFADLLAAVADEAIRPDDGRVPSGYFADTLIQTAVTLGALLEGLMLQEFDS